MCECKWFNGDSCDYPDYANGQTEDGYCGVEDDCSECEEYEEYEEEDDENK